MNDFSVNLLFLLLLIILEHDLINYGGIDKKYVYQRPPETGKEVEFFDPPSTV